MKASFHAATNGRRHVCVLAVALGALATGATNAHAATWVVDRDGAECANADFTSIQAAISAAAPGDLIEVCPDVYRESVTVDKPLTLKGDPDAVEADDCFSLAEADPARHAIVDPPGDGFSVALQLGAGDVDLSGFVVQGASVGIDTSDSFSGYRIHHNVVQSNTLFAMDVGSDGTRESRFDHNCVRNNRGAFVGTAQLGWGIVSELDDDSLWKLSDGPERDDWNARDLINARIDHNTTWRNANAGIDTAGPGLRDRVMVDSNRAVGEAGVILQHSTDSAIVDNEVIDASGNAIVIGGGNQRLTIAGNRVRGAGLSGVIFIDTLIDRFPIPSTSVVVSDNDVRLSRGSGIVASSNNLAKSLISGNTLRENGGTGLLLTAGTENVISGNVAIANSSNGIQFSSSNSEVRANTSNRNVMNGIAVNGSGSQITDNVADDNLRNGITVMSIASGNWLARNSMHGNASADPALFFDARDLNWPNNIWIDNDCESDNQAGAICGAG